MKHTKTKTIGNYVARVVEKLQRRLPDCEPDLLRYYALLVLVLGKVTTRQDVHDAWAIWRDSTDPEHRSLVPYDELTAEVKMLDEPYAHAIRMVSP
jgi:hypothetical protein